MPQGNRSLTLLISSQETQIKLKKANHKFKKYFNHFHFVGNVGVARKNDSSSFVKNWILNMRFHPNEQINS